MLITIACAIALACLACPFLVRDTVPLNEDPDAWLIAESIGRRNARKEERRGNHDIAAQRTAAADYARERAERLMDKQ